MPLNEIGRRYAGRTALIVGAATGIGLATAQRLAREGARVAVTDLDGAEAAAALATLEGDGHVALEIDVLHPDTVDPALDRLGATGPIDVVVHVAGGDTAHGPFQETGDDVWRAMFELNLLGPVRVVRAALPWLRASRQGPAIAIVSSVNGLVAVGGEPYSAAKAGLTSVVANLAAELGPDGVRINAVAPGTVRTRVWDAQGGPDRLADRYPLRRVGEPEDIAAALAFLCSGDAAWITGHVLPVDGGLLARRVL